MGTIREERRMAQLRSKRATARRASWERHGTHYWYVKSEAWCREFFGEHFERVKAMVHDPSLVTTDFDRMLMRMALGRAWRKGVHV